MHLTSEKISLRTVLVYLIFLAIAFFVMYADFSHKEHAESVQVPQSVLASGDPATYIAWLASSDIQQVAYSHLVDLQTVFLKNFPEASDLHKKVFEIYYGTTLSAKHPNLYKKLSILERALVTLDAEIEKSPNSYELRVARINIHSALPIYFRNRTLVNEDIAYLINGYNRQQEFEFLDGLRRITKVDLGAINISNN